MSEVPESRPHETLTREIGQLQDLAREWTRLFPQAVSQGEHWLKVLDQVRAHVAEDLSRLAVVGAVKSGKSTLINALVGRDVLKRGAGILTAMITRVQPGPEAEAVLRFKDWAEIQGEVQRALSLFPSAKLRQRAGPLDLREAPDRELLAQLLNGAETANLWSGAGLNQDYLLLKSYLGGYDLLADRLAQGEALTLTGADLARHRDLVTREASAVYLKDALLTLPMPWWPAGVELGDCQGSDSPIPQHLTQVLAYLIKTDLALYVISSRVGLRQADFQFLAELQRMGLAGDTLFLLNLDLGEHQGLEEVLGLRDRVARELSTLLPQPPLYAFSALKLLLERRQAQGEALEGRDAALLSLWGAEEAAAAFADQEARRFEADLFAAVRHLQSRRLEGGSFSQVRLVAQGLREQLALTENLLGQDMSALKDLETRLGQRRRSLEDTLNSLRQTLEGAGTQLKKVLKNRINAQLDPQGGLGGALQESIRGYEPDWEALLPREGETSLSAGLYRLFQEFQKSLLHYAASEINVQLLEFIRGREEWLREELARAWSPLLLALKEALGRYYEELTAFGFPAVPPALELGPLPRPAGLEPPLLNLQLDPGRRWAGEVWVRAGMGFLRRAWETSKRRLGLGAAADPRTQLLQDLGRALKALKGWLREQVKLQLLDYQERLKFQYFFPLVDYWLKSGEAGLENNLRSLMADLEGLAGSMRLQEEERAACRARLAALAPRVREVEASLVGGGDRG